MLKAEAPSGGVLFEEKQRFPKWLTLLMAGIVLFTIVITIVVTYVTTKDVNAMIAGVSISLVTELLVIWLFNKVQLEKVVTTNGLYYRWKPWQRNFRVIEKESIKNFEVRKNPPLNYGIHWFPGYGWVHNASEGEGLQLYLVNGNKIYFSTFDTAFFKRALENLISSNVKSGFSEF